MDSFSDLLPLDDAAIRGLEQQLTSVRRFRKILRDHIEILEEQKRKLGAIDFDELKREVALATALDGGLKSKNETNQS